MSGAVLIVSRLLMLVFVPCMLLLPLLIAWLIPQRDPGDAARLKARGQLVFLALFTCLALALWLGLLLMGRELPWAGIAAQQSWLAFFPLWFWGAMRVAMTKNPAWTQGALPTNEGAPTIRVASLVNRERLNPIPHWMMWIPVAIFLLALAGIAARGWELFSEVDRSGVALDTLAVERNRWLLITPLFLTIFGLNLAMLPLATKRTLTEPEPLDSRGSQELQMLYDRQRSRRVWGLYWLIGVFPAGLMGLIFNLMIWLPSSHQWLGFIGGAVGGALGIAGGIFGTKMTVERLQIAELRRQFEQQ